MRRYRAIFWIFLVLALAQAACNLPTAPSASGTVFPTFQVTPTFAPGQPSPTPGSNPPDCTHEMAFIGDVTIPDDSVVQRGASFIKTWRVRNDGTCSWGPGGFPLSSLVFTGGDKLSAPDQVPLLEVVGPGQTVDLSVTMVAPAQPGTYTSLWKLRIDNGLNAEPQFLGLGRSKNDPLYVRVKVE